MLITDAVATALTELGPPRHAETTRSGVCETRWVGLSGAVASLVVVVPHVTRQGTGRVVRALGMICLCVRGGAGLVPAVGLIRSLSALTGVTHHSLAARFPCTQTGVNRTLRVKPEDQRGCLQIRWTTWSVSTRTETSTRSQLWSRQPVSLLHNDRCVRADAGMRRRGVSQSSRPVLVSGRWKAPATTVPGLLAT